MSGSRLLFGWLVPLVVAAGWLIAQKRDLVAMTPGPFAALAGVVVVLLCVDLVLRGWRVARRALALAPGLCGLAWRAGVLVSLVGGFAAWAFGLQGFVVLTEGVSLPVAGAAHLMGFEAGPLANTAELGHFLKLEKLDLVARGPSSFSPMSSLRYEGAGQPAWRGSVEPGRPAFLGALRFQQGTFGFAPNIVIDHAGRRVFSEVVPFTTARGDDRAPSFDGAFEVEGERLLVEGTVSLDQLDAEMKGHAELLLHISQDGRPLGRGSLKPGEFADLDGGYRVGFVGLKRWSEIDLSRNTSPLPILAGAGLAALGLLAQLVVFVVARARA